MRDRERERESVEDTGYLSFLYVNDTIINLTFYKIKLNYKP